MLDEQTARDLFDVLGAAHDPNVIPMPAEALDRLSDWALRQPAYLQVLHDIQTEYVRSLTQ